MAELARTRPKALALNEGIEQVEAHMLGMDQVDCPVTHHFGPTDPETGYHVYIREVILPMGITAIGHRQKKRHLNVMITGKVAVVDEGKVKVLTAPLIFNGEPGRKVGYVMETCVWQNQYVTKETDIEKIEAEFLDKSETFENYQTQLDCLNRAIREVDRLDFADMLEEYGFDEKTVRDQSEKESDQIEMPEQWRSFTQLRGSNIEGKGMFLSCPVNEFTVVAPARISGMRTPAGRYVNHSKDPNCEFVRSDNGDIYLVSVRPIAGAKGGSHGEELTVDYRQALELSGIERKRKCQE